MSLPDPMSNYILETGGSGVVSDRIVSLLLLTRDLLGEEETVHRTFISEYVDPNGSRTYESVWFFTDVYALEARNFLASDDIDCVFMKENIGYLRLVKSDFSPSVEASPQSRMSVTVNFGTPTTGSLGGVLKASGRNCNYLYEIIKSVFVPNMIRK